MRVAAFMSTLFQYLYALSSSSWSSSSSTNEQFVEIDSNIFSCLSNITAEFGENAIILVMAEEIRSHKFASILFEHLGGSLTIQTADNYGGKFGFFLLFPAQPKSYAGVLKRIQPFLYNRFLIIWPTTSTVAEMKTMMDEFWRFRLLNVVVIQQQRQRQQGAGPYATSATVYAYSYDPYDEASCDEAKVSLVDVWNATSTSFAGGGRTLYDSERRLRNLRGCSLTCFAKNRPPDSLLVRVNDTTGDDDGGGGGGGGWTLDGVGGNLMREIRRRMNFTSRIIVPKLSVSVDEYGYDISQGYPELVGSQLHNGGVDLAFGIYSHIIYDDPRTEFSMPAVSECYGWAVPAHQGKKISAWMYYTHEFQPLVWWLIVLELCVSAGVAFLVLRGRGQYASAKAAASSGRLFRDFGLVLLYVFSLTLGMSASPRVKRGGRSRLLVGGVIAYAMVVVSAYQSSLGSFLTVPWKRQQIKTFREILEAGYEGVGVPQARRILKRFSADDRVLNRLSERFRIHSDHFESLVARLQRRKDVVTFGAQRFIQFYINHKLNSTEREEVYLLPKCVIEAHASPFLFKKGSYFLKPINNIVSAAVESGLTNFWYTYSTPKTSSQFAKIQPLTIHQLQSAFVLLIIGNSIATLLFIFELRLHGHTRC